MKKQGLIIIGIIVGIFILFSLTGGFSKDIRLSEGESPKEIPTVITCVPDYVPFFPSCHDGKQKYKCGYDGELEDYPNGVCPNGCGTNGIYCACTSGETRTFNGNCQECDQSGNWWTITCDTPTISPKQE